KSSSASWNPSRKASPWSATERGGGVHPMGIGPLPGGTSLSGRLETSPLPLYSGGEGPGVRGRLDCLQRRGATRRNQLQSNPSPQPLSPTGARGFLDGLFGNVCLWPAAAKDKRGPSLQDLCRTYFFRVSSNFSASSRLMTPSPSRSILSKSSGAPSHSRRE